MKKLQIISRILLLITLVVFVLWRFVITVPDWVGYVNGILMLGAIFTTVFSSVRIAASKK